MPAIAVHPSGNQLFIGWLDRRNDTNNSLIDAYGVWGTIASNGDVSFHASEFRITTESFPPAFAGATYVSEGEYDPVYAPVGVNLNWWYGDARWPESLPPPFGDHPNLTTGGYEAMVGEHQWAWVNSRHVYFVWSDSRKSSQGSYDPSRKEADIRLARLPWP